MGNTGKMEEKKVVPSKITYNLKTYTRNSFETFIHINDANDGVERWWFIRLKMVVSCDIDKNMTRKAVNGHQNRWILKRICLKQTGFCV